MNRVIIFRFGIDKPITADVSAVTVLTNGDLGNAMGLPFPGGVISLVETEFSPSEIAEVYRVTAIQLNDTLPVMVFPADHTCGIYLSEAAEIIQTAIDRFIEGGLDAIRNKEDIDVPEPEQEVSHSVVDETCEMSLDELLDRLNEVGSFEALTTVQQERLKKLTQ